MKLERVFIADIHGYGGGKGSHMIPFSDSDVSSTVTTKAGSVKFVVEVWDDEEEDDEAPKTTSADVNAKFEAYMEEKRQIEDPAERLSEINSDMMLIKTGFVL